MSDPNERAALRRHGLHWIGLPQTKSSGILGLSLETATLLAAMPFVLDHIAAAGSPSAFAVRGVTSERTQRVKVTPL